MLGVLRALVGRGRPGPPDGILLDVAEPDPFTYRRAIEQHAFVQVPLLDARQFAEACRQRSLPAFDEAGLEGLDFDSLLPPVAFRLRGPADWGTEAALLREGRLLLREEQEFTPWAELRDAHGTHVAGAFMPLYSQWQLLTLWELWQQIQPQPATPFLQAGLDATLADRKAVADWVDRDGLMATADAGRRRDLLLIRTQTILVPRITARYVTTEHAELGDTAEWTFALEESFDWAEAARECGVDSEGLAGQYSALAVRGMFIDPLQRWWLLVDQTRWAVKQRLRGDARMALDYYEAARVVRGWHSQLSAEALPDIDELGDPEQAREAKRRLFGDAQVRNNRAALVPLLDDYGLYPWRVQLIVEGPSERNLLGELLRSRGHTFASLGILVIALGGAGVPKRTEELLDVVRPYANTYFLVFDNEGNITKLIEELQRRRTIDVSDVHRWASDLEADNFTVEELCDVVEAHIKTKDSWPEFTLDRAEIQARVATEASRRDGKGVLSVIHDVAEDQTARFDKDDVAIDLAAHADAHPQRPDGLDRPVFALLDDLIMAAESDRRPPA